MSVGNPFEQVNYPEHEYRIYFDIFKYLNVSIQMYGRDGSFINANNSCLNLLGVDQINDLIGTNLFHLSYLPVHLIADVNAGHTIRQEFEIDFDHIQSAGQFKTKRKGTSSFFAYIYSFRNSENLIAGFICQAEEISVALKSETENESKRIELEKLNVTKDRFLSMISHDLKNPLNVVMGFSEMLLTNFDQVDEETVLKGLETMHSASNHAFRILENLVICSQNHTGKTPFQPKNLNLYDQVEKTLMMMERHSLKKEITINNTIKKSIAVYADKNMLEIVLKNLISNAIKYSHPGGKIKISAIQSDNELKISISDKGVGIRKDLHLAIFEIDRRICTSGTEDEQGSGLGLAICKDFIERHSGRIWVESLPEKGSTFTIGLPIV